MVEEEYLVRKTQDLGLSKQLKSYSVQHSRENSYPRWLPTSGRDKSLEEEDVELCLNQLYGIQRNNLFPLVFIRLKREFGFGFFEVELIYFIIQNSSLMECDLLKAYLRSGICLSVLQGSNDF